MPMTKSATPNEWLRLAETTERLNYSADTVRRWADAGHIRTSRTPGGQRRFWREDVERIARGEAPALAEVAS